MISPSSEAVYCGPRRLPDPKSQSSLPRQHWYSAPSVYTSRKLSHQQWWWDRGKNSKDTWWNNFKLWKMTTEREDLASKHFFPANGPNLCLIGVMEKSQKSKVCGFKLLNFTLACSYMYFFALQASCHFFWPKNVTQWQSVPIINLHLKSQHKCPSVLLVLLTLPWEDHASSICQSKEDEGPEPDMFTTHSLESSSAMCSLDQLTLSLPAVESLVVSC